jgi:Mrp family chromosome partitioning ATPase
MDIDSQAGIGIKPLLSLKRHYRVSLVVAVLVFVLGLPVVWIKGQSTYIAEAMFQVSPRYMKNLESDAEVEMQSNTQYREYVNHLSSTVTRYDVVQHALAALKKRNVSTKPPALTERQYIERLQKTVYVRAVPDTYMVRVGTDGGPGDKAHLHDLINAIMASFLETTKDEQIYGSSERLNVLNDSATKLRNEISPLGAERIQLSEKLGLSTFNDNTVNPFDQLLDETRKKLTQAEIDRKTAEATYRAFAQQHEIPAELGRSLLDMRLSDTGLQALRESITRRVEELNQQVSGLGEKHPARAPALAEVKSLTERLRTKEEEFDKRVFENYQKRLLGTLSQKQEVESELRKTQAQLESQSASFARMFQRALQITKEIHDREDRLGKIQGRLNYIETERNALGFVHLVTPALPAETPMGTGKVKLLLGVIAAALGLGLVAPMAIDMLDRRIRSVTDAEKLMGMPAAGWQIFKESLATRILGDDQIRRFVSALIRIRERSQRRTFAFTSVKPAGGTTSTILDTAAMMAQIGARALVLEVNTFAPFAGFDSLRPGLTDYLSGRAELAELPHTYTHNGQEVTVVAIGSAYARGMQRLDLLRQAVASWEASYDFLLCDLAPVLLSGDAEMLIEALGQVFLVVEGESVTRGEVTRAKRLLQKIDPEAVGLFVNRIPLFHGSGYMEGVLIETLTRSKLSRFMSRARWRLQWEMLRARWSGWRARRRGAKQKKTEAEAEAEGRAAPALVAGGNIRPAAATEPPAPLAEAELRTPPVGPSPGGETGQDATAVDATLLRNAARRQCELADAAPNVQSTVNAAKAIYALLNRLGWHPALAARADGYLRRAEELDPTNQRLAAARQMRAVVRTKYRIADA